MSDLVTLDAGVATTTSLKIADGTEVQHKNVLELIRDNIDDLAEFGRVAFETQPFQTAGGQQNREVAYLTEEHATLLLTYMRNSAIVRDFKKRLVREFWQLRRGEVPAIPQTYAEALRAAADQAERAEVAEARVAVLEPKAEVADKLLDADGDLSVRDAAQMLTRAGIKTGERRLFSTLAVKKWIRRSVGDGRYRAIQAAIESGYISVLPQSHYHPRTGELILDPPQIRITPKGLQKLLKDGGVS